MAKITIVTINFNNREGLERTFESVFLQRQTEFEFIVIDGGSDDGSVELIKENSAKITYWESKKDNGIYHAMNKGITASTGDFINFINSGDVLSSKYSLSVANSIISEQKTNYNSDYILVMDCLTVDEEHLIMMKGNALKSKSDAIANFLPHPSTFYAKHSFEKYHCFNEAKTIVSDFEWYMTAIFKNNFRIRYYPFCYSVFYKDGISSMNTNTHKLEFDEIIQKHVTNFQLKMFTSRKYKFLKRFYFARKFFSLIRFDSEINLILLK